MRINTNDLFFSEGQSLDLTQGLDVADLFNSGVAPLFNDVDNEEELELASISEPAPSVQDTPQLPAPQIQDLGLDQEEFNLNLNDPLLEGRDPLAESKQQQAQQSLMMQNLENSFSNPFNPVNASIQPQMRGVEDSSDFSKYVLPDDQDYNGGDISDFTPKSVSKGGIKVLNLTRDQLKSKKSVVGNRLHSKDFNDFGGAKPGLEMVVPWNATKAEIASARANLKQKQALYKKFGHHVPIRKGDDGHGIKKGRYPKGSGKSNKGRRGVPGFFHHEDHEKSDKKAREILKNNPEAFAEIDFKTFGNGSTFIAPHKTNDPGAIGFDKIGERDFYRKFIFEGYQKALQNKS